MAKRTTPSPFRKSLFKLMLVAESTNHVFGHDNPKVEKADRALVEAINLLRDAVEWQDQHDPELTALTQHQVDQTNEALRFQLDPEYRQQCLEDAKQAEHDKRRFDLERLMQSDEQEGI